MAKTESKINIFSQKPKININGQVYGERELAQIIRRKMMARAYKSEKTYSRKLKHKNQDESVG